MEDSFLGSNAPFFKGDLAQIKAFARWFDDFERAAVSRIGSLEDDPEFVVDIKALNRVLVHGEDHLDCLNIADAQKVKQLISKLQFYVAALLAGKLSAIAGSSEEHQELDLKLRTAIQDATPYIRWLGCRTRDELAARENATMDVGAGSNTEQNTPTGSGQPEQKGEILPSVYAKQREALADLSVAYMSARDFSRQVLCTAFGDPLPDKCEWPPVTITPTEAQSRLKAVQRFLQQTEGVFQKVLRDIRDAQVALGASGFDVPRSWIITEPLDKIRGGYLDVCSVTEIVKSVLAEDEALENAQREIAVDLVLLESRIAEATAKANAEEKQAEKTNQKSRMTAEEANEKAKQLAKKDPSFVNKKQREWAEAIGCSDGLINKLPLWQKTMEKTGRGRKERGTKPKKVSLTKAIEETVGEGEKHEQLSRLIAEQEQDYEPSPLDPKGRNPINQRE